MYINSAMIEILILGCIAAAIAYKFYSMLGEDRGIAREDMAVQPKFNTEQTKDNNQSDLDRTQDKALVPAALQSTYDQIVSSNPDFFIGSFLQGANIAFEMIVKAYTTGDTATLRSLTNEQTYQEFTAAIDERAVQQHRLMTTIIKIEPLTIEDLRFDNSLVDIKIRYVSEQTNILYDESNNIIEGSPNQSEQITDTWTYQRDIQSRDPNWRLIDTGL